MDAVVEQQLAVGAEVGVEVDDVQAVFTRYFLLDRDDAVDNDGIADVPSGLDGRDGSAEIDLRTGGLGGCLLRFLRFLQLLELERLLE